MTTLSYGLVALLNGFLSMMGALMTPLTAGVIVLALGMAWLARLELDDLKRQGTKPEVGRH